MAAHGPHKLACKHISETERSRQRQVAMDKIAHFPPIPLHVHHMDWVRQLFGCCLGCARKLKHGQGRADEEVRAGRCSASLVLTAAGRVGADPAAECRVITGTGTGKTARAAARAVSCRGD